MGRVRHNSAVFRVHNREKPRLRPPRHCSLEKRVRSLDDADFLPSTRNAFCVPCVLVVARRNVACITNYVRPVYEIGNGIARKSCARAFPWQAGSCRGRLRTFRESCARAMHARRVRSRIRDAMRRSHACAFSHVFASTTEVTVRFAIASDDANRMRLAHTIARVRRECGASAARVRRECSASAVRMRRGKRGPFHASHRENRLG